MTAEPTTNNEVSLATNPGPDLFHYAAAQVAHCMTATHRLGGTNHVP